MSESEDKSEIERLKRILQEKDQELQEERREIDQMRGRLQQEMDQDRELQELKSGQCMTS